MPIHIRAQPGDVAPFVLLPGDPGRARRVAERFDGARCYNEFRGLLGYTGTYKGIPMSVQTTGMGAPSAAIVVEELAMLGAKIVVRIGTCGGTLPDIRLTDLIVANAACAFDGTTRQYMGERYQPKATPRVVDALVISAQTAGACYHVGPVATEDALYAVTPETRGELAARGLLAQEMEASAVFTVASLRGLEAGCILTASNAVGQHERLAGEKLEPVIDSMITVALEAAVALSPTGTQR